MHKESINLRNSQDLKQKQVKLDEKISNLGKEI